MIQRNHRLLSPLVLAAALVLAGCATPITKVGGGQASVVAERLTVTSDAAWNQLPKPPGTQEAYATTWTVDGTALDALHFYVGVKDGTRMGTMPQGNEAQPIVFKAAMQPHEVVALFESLYARDGSSFKLDKLEPAEFLGGKGFRFNYTVVRKFDDVRLSGSAWATVRDGELHAITFTAPALGFHPRLASKVEAVAASARLKS